MRALTPALNVVVRVGPHQIAHRALLGAEGWGGNWYLYSEIAMKAAWAVVLAWAMAGSGVDRNAGRGNRAGGGMGIDAGGGEVGGGGNGGNGGSTSDDYTRRRDGSMANHVANHVANHTDVCCGGRTSCGGSMIRLRSWIWSMVSRDGDNCDKARGVSERWDVRTATCGHHFQERRPGWRPVARTPPWTHRTDESTTAERQRQSKTSTHACDPRQLR